MRGGGKNPLQALLKGRRGGETVLPLLIITPTPPRTEPAEAKEDGLSLGSSGSSGYSQQILPLSTPELKRSNTHFHWANRAGLYQCGGPEGQEHSPHPLHPAVVLFPMSLLTWLSDLNNWG